MRLENDHVIVTMLPESAGKIVEIVNRRTGRNWLWKNAALSHCPSPGAGSYESKLDSGGWDEILLSVTPGAVPMPDGSSIDVPDHGDLVGRPWQRGAAGVDGDGNAFCTLTASGRAAAYAWRRKLVLERGQPRLRFEYQLENTGATVLPYSWCAHPLLATERGMKILLPTGLPLRLDSGNGASTTSNDRPTRWPLLPVDGGQVIDLSRCVDSPAPGTGYAAKVFVRSNGSADVTVECANGEERLVLHYDRDTIPWLGLWINDRGWTGTGGRPYLNLGLEPSTTPCDSLAQAVARDEVPFLQPGESRQWWLDLTLRGANPATDATCEFHQ